MSALLEQHKKWFRESLQADLREELAQLRASYPTMSIEHLMGMLRKRKPLLMAEAERVEAAANWDLEAGWDTETAKKALQEQTDQADRAAEIRVRIDQMRKADPTLSFEQAWNILLQKRPELFGYSPGE